MPIPIGTAGTGAACLFDAPGSRSAPGSSAPSATPRPPLPRAILKESLVDSMMDGLKSTEGREAGTALER